MQDPQDLEEAERKLRDAQWEVRKYLMQSLLTQPEVFMQFDWYERYGAPCVERHECVRRMKKKDVD